MVAVTDSKRLRAEYDGVDEAIPDVLLALDGPLTLHLAAHDRDGPECRRSPDHNWELVDVDDASEFGGRLCRACFELHLEHLARDPSSPVERVARAEAVSHGEVAAAVEKADGGRLAPLSSLTDRVARLSGSSSVFHAPTADGALCGAEVDTIDDRELLPGYRPCKDCFDVDRSD